jgi:hypothetical protein
MNLRRAFLFMYPPPDYLIGNRADTDSYFCRLVTGAHSIESIPHAPVQNLVSALVACRTPVFVERADK